MLNLGNFLLVVGASSRKTSLMSRQTLLTFPINNFALLQFCGSCVAVLSLLSPCVARFRLDQARDQVVDAVIQQRSLYVMKGFSRYECTHEILKNEESYFNGVEIVKGRRVSVICRNEAKS